MTRPNPWIAGRHPSQTVRRIFWLLLACLLLFGVLARPVKFEGISMQPTYGDGGYSLMFPLIYMWRGPERGDVVAIRMPGGGAFYVKRILGLPGEEIQFDKGSLLINQQTIPEPYIQHKGEWDLQPIRIPAGYYFVAGDNRLTSFDGHTLGTVNRKRIAGIVYP